MSVCGSTRRLSQHKVKSLYLSRTDLDPSTVADGERHAAKAGSSLQLE